MTANSQLRQPFTVLLANRGNPDFGQDPERCIPGTPADQRVPAQSLSHASSLCRQYIAAHSLGGGNWAGGDVVDSAGQSIAHVAYNGRVFSAHGARHLLQEAGEDLADEAGEVAQQVYQLTSHADGSISGTVWTNDNLDRGTPNETATWEVRYRDRTEMDRSAGTSRVGVSGVLVHVYLDGKPL